MQLRNSIVVPPRLYKLFAEATRIRVAAECPDDGVLLVDADGHVHELKYKGRLIDRPPPWETSSEETP